MTQSEPPQPAQSPTMDDFVKTITVVQLSQFTLVTLCAAGQGLLDRAAHPALRMSLVIAGIALLACFTLSNIVSMYVASVYAQTREYREFALTSLALCGAQTIVMHAWYLFGPAPMQLLAGTLSGGFALTALLFWPGKILLPDRK